MDTTSYLNPVMLCAQFNHVIRNLEEEKNAYENLKKDMEEKILNGNTLQGETAESLKAYAADYILILGLLIMANEDDISDAEKMIHELNTEDSPLVETTAVLDGFQILTMLQDAKGKEDMYNRLADEYARAADECGMLEGILKAAYRDAAEEYRRKAEDEHKKVEMCQARVDRYDRIEADTKECFKRSGEPRSLANAALDAMPCSFLNGEYKMDIRASWRLDIKVYQYTRERDLFSLRQFSSTEYNKIINSSYEDIFPEFYNYQMITRMIEVAKSELEGHEYWEINGNNKTVYGEWYYGDDRAAAWCSIFVFYCANQAGMLNGTMLPELNDCRSINIALVTNVQKWFIDNNRYYSLLKSDENFAPDYIPCVGDFFISRRLSSDGTWQYHIGIVTGYDTDKMQITTLEGNSDDKIAQNHRTVEEMEGNENGIVGFCKNGCIEIENYMLSGYFEDLGENTR